MPNSSGLCLAACKDAMVTWSKAKDACAAAGQWQLAVFGTTLAAAKSALQMPISWIGLTRDAVGQDWRWIDGSGSVAQMSPEWSGSNGHGGLLNAYTCAGLGSGTLYSDGCEVTHAYACTPN